MKLKNGFILREIAGETVVVPSGGELDINLMITLNETATYLWKRLEVDSSVEALVKALLEEYDVDSATAHKAVADFVGELNAHGFLEN